MVMGPNGVVCMEAGASVADEEEDTVSSCTRRNLFVCANNGEDNGNGNLGLNSNAPFSSSMLETDDWYFNSGINPSSSSSLQNHPDIAFSATGNLLLHSIDSSSCSPSHPFPLDPLLPPKSCFSSLVSVLDNGFSLGCDSSLFPQYQPSHLMPFTDSEGFGDLGIEGFDGRAKVLRPPEVLPPVGSPPNLFQKRAMLRQNENSEVLGEEEGSFDVSGLNYDSDEHKLENDGGSNSKGKKKGMPAKNLMAERRRRKRLNDRLYMLRSVVPNISKMDRTSILGDAIDYLKELLQRINHLHNELDSTTATFPSTLPCRVKEETCPSSFPSPRDQHARVEVRVTEGRAVNIHMMCARRPGLLVSTMRALESVGLDIQQAVISCFNGFALDVFRAEQCRESWELAPEQIKAVLLDSAGMM